MVPNCGVKLWTLNSSFSQNLYTVQRHSSSHQRVLQFTFLEPLLLYYLAGSDSSLTQKKGLKATQFLLNSLNVPSAWSENETTPFHLYEAQEPISEKSCTVEFRSNKHQGTTDFVFQKQQFLRAYKSIQNIF